MWAVLVLAQSRPPVNDRLKSYARPCAAGIGDNGEDFISLKGLTEPDLLALDLGSNGGLFVVAFINDDTHY
jgi:hypothetical protein